MYDVYLNGRNDLLIVPRGYSIPSDFERQLAQEEEDRAVGQRKDSRRREAKRIPPSKPCG
jgi:hypothetical protein